MPVPGYKRITPLHNPKAISAAMIGGGAIGAISGLILVGILSAIPGGIIIAPSIFIIVAWGAGLGGSISGYWYACQNLSKHQRDKAGWFVLLVSTCGVLATVGSIIGTFLPVPVLGTLAGAAAGAVFGVLFGLGIWLATALIFNLVEWCTKKCMNDLYEENRFSEDAGLSAHISGAEYQESDEEELSQDHEVLEEFNGVAPNLTEIVKLSRSSASQSLSNSSDSVSDKPDGFFNKDTNSSSVMPAEDAQNRHTM